MLISDWSSDVCSSDLGRNRPRSATRKRACAMKRTKSVARRLAIDVRHVAVMIGAPTLMGALAGCVQIETPDKPIEINLNINIRQEVVYRLDGDAKKLIEQNSEIF